MARVAAVGEIVEDHYLDDGARFLGGISVNFARCARFAGAEAAVYAPIGDDARAERLWPLLASTGLTLRVRRAAGVTPEQRIVVGPDGERGFCGFDAGVLGDYLPSDEELDEIAQYDAVAVPCSLESRRAFRCIAAQAWAPDKLIADFSQDSPDGQPDRPDSWVAPWADRIRIAFVGGAAHHARALCALSRRVAPLIVLTAGEAGAFAFSRGRSWHQPTVAERVVDTTGCGDAFQAGFSVCQLDGGDIVASLRAGAELAARVARQRGIAVDMGLLPL